MISTIDLCLSVFLGVMLIVYIDDFIIISHFKFSKKKRWKKQ